MSAKHRKASKLAAKRTAVAATAVGATAAVGLMSAPAQAATTPPNYSKAISDYSHALDNFLNAANNVNASANSVWGPIANGSGGLLPTFGSTFTQSDATKITDLPQILKNIGSIKLPTGVPGVVPDIVLPGGGKVSLPFPAELPGGSLLIGAGETLEKILALPLVGDIVGGLPAVSELIKGLEITQSQYKGGYDWKFLGINGETIITNTFVKTPDGLTLILPGDINLGGINIPIPPILGGGKTEIPLVPNGTLPSGTIWLPQGSGTYNFPLGGQLGWWGAMPTAALKIPGWLGGSETVVAAPIYAAGAALPLNIAKVGVLGASVLLPTQNGVYSPISATMTNLSTFLPFGLTNLNVTTGNYIGTNGINVNNGQNLMMIQNPLGIPLPLVYGLGGFNFGVNGMGLTSPSLFGFKLFTDDLLQIGTKAGPNTSAGLIPPGLLPTDPMSGIITGITGPLGVSSLTQLLGLDAVIKPVMTAFGPVWATFVTPVLKPLSDIATQQYGTAFNGAAASILDLSQQAVDRSAGLPGAPTQSDAGASAAAAKTTGGSHRAEDGGTPVSTLLARNTGAEQAPSGSATDQQSSTATDSTGTSGGTVTAPSAPEPPVATPTPEPSEPTSVEQAPETSAAESSTKPDVSEPDTAPAETAATEAAPSATESASTDAGTATDSTTDKAA
ncbi:hypothetical protein [Tsukamurella ocularis]|uniref:hypothetical protein n=1 Tax=Tsukamurella ocularis TaxID=1970234 RepID=UPI002168FB9E|nr:hypothetical protein [Tsukamurella ocularis]MCS3782351.1 hypothetical protein [Tsukamurella ocularis]MCS3789489.1 hypothetical protein [Tsukamurella ocularis]MCS3852636.1 hypothetical protein [Tsukamurella ocularis]